MVEGVIAAGLVLFIVFAVFQAAFLGRSYIAVRDAAAAGARAQSVAAATSAADYDTIEAVKRSMQTSSKKQITKIVVFEAHGTDSEVPTACLSGGVSGKCNYYSLGDYNHSLDEFEAGTVTAAQDWPAEGRQASITDGRAYVGVYVEVEVGNAGSSPFPTTLTHTAVVHLDAATY